VKGRGGVDRATSVLSRYRVDLVQTTCGLESPPVTVPIPVIGMPGVLLPCLHELLEIRRILGHGGAQFPEMRLTRKGIATLSPSWYLRDKPVFSRANGVIIVSCRLFTHEKSGREGF
jgi:hypothetical protein